MTLVEAVRHAQEMGRGCDACSKEHRQLAKWLAALEAWRDAEQSRIYAVHSYNAEWEHQKSKGIWPAKVHEEYAAMGDAEARMREALKALFTAASISDAETSTT